jgi:superfamily II DNA or RNA helicase/HKD family nuclease
MAGVEKGLYEQLITLGLDHRLRGLDAGAIAVRTELHAVDAADRIALHLANVLERLVANFSDATRTKEGLALAERLLRHLAADKDRKELEQDIPVESQSVLHAILDPLPDGSAPSIRAPLIPLLDTALLTNAPGEPTVGSQIASEIHSADRIDVVMAFIRFSGILPILPALRLHRERGRRLRVLTTTYTGSTEPRALDALLKIGADIRISYDTSSTRLHAKAWLFHRASGFSTAYIGSSNLTHSAQVSGLEWNVRVAEARNRTLVGKVEGLFEAYWNNPEFEAYEPVEFLTRSQSQNSDPFTTTLSPVEIRLEPFQERLLELIALSRASGHHRNLLAAATGTGKTVMAAVDYARLRRDLPRARLLFVAHRKEILEQAMLTFRHALRDGAFGELWVDGNTPAHFEHVFASIQSLSAAGFAHLTPDHFDVVIVDEIHHAAAASYERLLQHLNPTELLGLTATPERSDGVSILPWFGDRIAAELRLWDAIDQQRLAPFLYFGIADTLDLSEVPWRRGRGYEVAALTNVYTATDSLGMFVVKQFEAHVSNPKKARALGFCVSVEHARFMARIFCSANLPAVAIWADTPAVERTQALRELADGKICTLFSVDLFNEGVDVPAVDTILFLRPTDSPTLFLQQLGRGLRKQHGKSACTVLDFVGQHRREFRFDRRFRALLGGSRKDLEHQLKHGFSFLPAGCSLQLDPVATERVLQNVRNALPSQWAAKAAELRQLEEDHGPLSLSRFLDESGYELSDVYTERRGWSDLCEAAGRTCQAPGPHEDVFRRSLGRLLHIDDRERIQLFRQWLHNPNEFVLTQQPERNIRLLRMLAASIANQELKAHHSLPDALLMLAQHPQVCAELLDLLEVLDERIDHLHSTTRIDDRIPLQIHARYSRIEILAAMGMGTSARVAPWQSGVLWAEEAHADLLAFTLDKTSGQFSPTTSYKDRAISRELIHWESQSVTRADSETGNRYQQHVAMGSHVFLFARLRADDRAFWFLGPATYVRHEGEQPMGITWRLHHPLPGDLYVQFAAAVA